MLTLPLLAAFLAGQAVHAVLVPLPLPVADADADFPAIAEKRAAAPDPTNALDVLTSAVSTASHAKISITPVTNAPPATKTKALHGGIVKSFVGSLRASGLKKAPGAKTSAGNPGIAATNKPSSSKTKKVTPGFYTTKSSKVAKTTTAKTTKAPVQESKTVKANKAKGTSSK